MGCAWSVMSGKSGRRDKLELGEFWMGPKDAGRIKSPIFVQIMQDEVWTFPNFQLFPANFGSASNSAIVLQQLNVKMIFLAKNAVKKKNKIKKE